MLEHIISPVLIFNFSICLEKTSSSFILQLKCHLRENHFNPLYRLKYTLQMMKLTFSMFSQNHSTFNDICQPSSCYYNKISEKKLKNQPKRGRVYFVSWPWEWFTFRMDDRFQCMITQPCCTRFFCDLIHHHESTWQRRLAHLLAARKQRIRKKRHQSLNIPFNSLTPASQCQAFKTCDFGEHSKFKLWNYPIDNTVM